MQMEPHVSLAFALQSNPGAYAVLLGAGASVASGMPSAWDVQQNLIERLAAAGGDTETGNLETWYEQRFGCKPSYDGLLNSLTSTPYERQALLNPFFEPDTQELEEGRKRPTPAHRALARLVASGMVRIILTTNFDRLTETALREAGIEPTVVSHPDDITGLAPLHTLKALVVHLHGDYLNPTSMLNTPEELEQYPEQVNVFLDRVFEDYGLVIAGWSGKWDPALRNAIARCSQRRLATFWADPRPLSEQAGDLLTLRAGTYVEADADTFIGQTSDAVTAMADLRRQHPISTAIAVASAKKALSGTQQAISLHDTLRREMNRVTALPLRSGPFNTADAEAEHARRLATLEAEAELLLALVATTAYWGNAETDPWWLSDIEQLAIPAPSGGSTALLNLVRAPATMVIYAAGVAATAKGRWSTVARLLAEPQAKNQYTGTSQPAAVLLDPWATLGSADSPERLHGQLRPVFTDHLALSAKSYADAWERFEYLRLLAAHHAGEVFDGAFIGPPRDAYSYKPVPSDWLRRELSRDGDQHLLLREGLAGGTILAVAIAQTELDEKYEQWAIKKSWGR
ncbi:SIR2 family protein [Streptomyces sp. 4.24]|uniref:SIR2 family protein n=1 Tax=Streptomyces tritrimontium TaxID=3406573 RepID=UPI003BB51DF0